MIRTLYTFGIRCYASCVRLAAPFNSKARQMVDGWNETFGRLAVSAVGKESTAWFHASSLGEFEQARPVLEQFRREHPDYRICVTFFSPSGYEVRKDYPLADFVCYLPMDTRSNALRFVNLLRPSVAFFVKYDFWFNYMEQLRQRAVPTFLFSAIFRPGQYFFKRPGRWFLDRIGQCFTHIFVQNDESLRLLGSRGIGQVSLAGDTRFDRVSAIAQEARRFEPVEAFLARRQRRGVIVAGSTWEPDEAHLKQYLDHCRGDIALVLAPHVISESHIGRIQQLFGKENCCRYSQPERHGADAQVLIIDTIGILASLYRYADVAYIGGGFGRGIHNILEAVTFGKPVVFGPNYRKFKEAGDIIARGGGFSYAEYRQLLPALDTLLNDAARRQAASEACRDYMAENLGSTEKILSTTNQYLHRH